MCNASINFYQHQKFSDGKKSPASCKGLKLLALQLEMKMPIEDLDNKFRSWGIDLGDNEGMVFWRLFAKTLILPFRHPKRAGQP